MASPATGRRLYRPGEHAPVTGIYRVTHAEHRAPHRAIVLRGEVFPLCRTCKDAVTFTVAHQASHITHDFDFAGPGALVLTRRSASE
jgi:hypothetical protein